MNNPVNDDPRIDPRLKAVFGNMPAIVLPDVPNRETLLARAAEAISRLADAPRPDAAPYEAYAPSAGLDIRTLAVPSQPDGNSINLQIIKPQGPGPYPCVYYIHGGGMMMSSCYDPAMTAFGRLIAHFGVAVVQVDFRNSLYPSSVPEVAPFPAGLNDCTSGLRHVASHGAQLGIDPARIIVAGESGGGNLSLATALKLGRDGDLDLLKGIYVMCPCIAGEWPGGPGTSADLNQGILMPKPTNYMATAYGIEHLHARNPLAWPLFASEEDLRGFPPTIINVNECDCLRDDGVEFYRLLLRAGVKARCRELIGTVHATEIGVIICPEISRDTARELALFARGD
jgi:acetyl esterase